MFLKQWRAFCLCAEDDALFPPDAQACKTVSAPLVFLVQRDPLRSRGLFRIRDLAERSEPETVRCLTPAEPASGELAGKSAAHFAAHTRDEVAVTISDDFGYLVPQRLDRTQDNSAVTLYFRSAEVLGPCRVVLTVDLPRILGALLLLFIIARPAIVFRPLATATAIFCARPWVIAPFVELKLPTNPHLHRTILRRYVQLIQVDSLRFT